MIIVVIICMSFQLSKATQRSSSNNKTDTTYLSDKKISIVLKNMRMGYNVGPNERYLCIAHTTRTFCTYECFHMRTFLPSHSVVSLLIRFSSAFPLSSINSMKAGISFQLSTIFFPLTLYVCLCELGAFFSTIIYVFRTAPSTFSLFFGSVVPAPSLYL